MKNKLYLFFVLFSILFSCDKKGVDCMPKACTMEFRTIGLQTQDKDGKSIAAIKVDATNARTKKQYLNIKSETYSFNDQIVYLIATDLEKADFSEAGDKLSVIFTTPTTKVTTELTIAGGACSCHISKISGPNIIVID